MRLQTKEERKMTLIMLIRPLDGRAEMLLLKERSGGASAPRVVHGARIVIS